MAGWLAAVGLRPGVAPLELVLLRQKPQALGLRLVRLWEVWRRCHTPATGPENPA